MSIISITMRRTWAEISIDSLINNYNVIRSHISDKTMLCCVIKANAYGHGAVELARLYSELGANFLAVSNIEEALQLRKNGIGLPILILGYTPAECAELLADFHISQCIYSIEYALELAQYAHQNNVKIKIHLKIDTGMGRIGFVHRNEAQSQLADILTLKSFDCFEYEGIFTHFSVADEGEFGREYTIQQYKNFMQAVDFLKAHDIHFKIHHCANSATMSDYPEMQFDMVRAGIILYGLQPSHQTQNKPEIKQAMSLKTVISNIKDVSAGEPIGYGRTFIPSTPCRIATLPIGYADGLFRSCTGYKVMVKGKPAPIVGRICMDQLMVDVSGIDCSVNDIVTIFGCDPGFTADDIALHNNTINYEIVCNIRNRVPRAYVKDNQILYWHNGLSQ